MLRRAQLNSLFIRRDNTFFPLIQKLAHAPNSDIANALSYAAYAREEDVRALVNM